MKIRRILLRNLHSIRSEVEVDFTKSPLSDVGLFAITGDTGSGKTTILDAITLAMYGNLCRQANPIDTLSFGAEEGLAECEFEAKGKRFLSQWRVRTTRSKDPSKRLKTERSVAEWNESKEEFLIVAERKVREVNALVEDVTGLDFPRFTRSVLLAQGEFAAFLKANEKERSDLLERITGTEIYSDLSKAALARKNIEHEKLVHLATQRDALQLLPTEELNKKKTELKSLKKEANSISASLTEVRSHIQVFEKIQVLTSKKETLEETKITIKKKTESLGPLLEKLNTHQKTSPYRHDLEKLKDQKEELENIKIDLNKIDDELIQLNKQKEKSDIELIANKNSLEKLKKEQPSALKKFEAVTSLDEKIQAQIDILKKHKLLLEDHLNRLQSLSLQKKEQKEKIEFKQKREKELSQWLKEQNNSADLIKDLPLIKNIRQTLRDILIEQRTSQDNFDQNQKKLKDILNSVKIKKEKWIEENKALEKLIVLFNQKTPKELTSSRHELLEKLNREIETAGSSQEQLRQLNEWNGAYLKLLTEVSKFEDELENLKIEELALDKELLSIVEASEEAEKKLKFKREIYRQQLLLASFETARSELKEGEECPVCLSTEHPYREKEIKPFVDEAKKELDTAEKVLDNIREKRNTLLKRHTEVASAIHHIDSSSVGQLGKLHLQIIELEKKIASLLPHIGAEEFRLSSGNYLQIRLKNFEKDLKEKKILRQELSEIHHQVLNHEKIVQSVADALKNLEFKVLALKENLQVSEQNLNELDKKFSKVTKELNELLKKYGHKFSIDTANGLFTELENKEKEFAEKNTEYISLSNNLILEIQKLEQQSSIEVELNQNITKLKEEELVLEEKLNMLKEKRTEMFGDKNPQKERELFLNKIEKSELLYTQTKNQYDELISNLKLAKKSKNDQENNLLKIKKNIQKIEEKLTGKLSALNFQTIEELYEAVLTEEMAESIRVQQEGLQKEQIELNQDFKNFELEWEKVHSNPLPLKPLEELKEEEIKFEKKSKEIQQFIGAIHQQLTDHEQRSKESNRLLESIAKQREEYNRWNDLYDLIGSSDGKKFRIFAQGLTLQKLVQLANLHLSNLHGRYFIVKRPGEDLELDIVDTYQAENVRSMHTLSGGESFLVSLALALGLSDLAGRNANIRSLFIDEGFGTLDDQALDVAITTLENLQASGKMIGVISHVKELKERISTQVRLIKKGGGVSDVEVIG